MQMSEQVISLYEGVAPGSETWTHSEVMSPWNSKACVVRNVVHPTLTIFLPKANATGAGVIIAPGGGFRMLAWESEGTEVAEWLVARGIAAFVLKYRLLDTGETEEQFRAAVEAMNEGPSDEKDAPEEVVERQRILRLAGADGLAAMKYVKEHAREFQVDAGRVGFMGFSAGGAVANQVLFEYTAETRPAFAAPIYAPVFGELTVSQDAPPIFLLCADDDNAVDPAGSVKMYLAWHAAGKSAELHIYRNGGHAFGMTRKSNATDGWIERYYEWLRGLGFLESEVAVGATAPFCQQRADERPVS
jgi:acetyl esterase/lipase